MKNPEKVKAGKLSRKRGNDFEKRVRQDIEDKGYIVDKWTNNVNIELDKLVPVRPKWIGGKIMMNSGGFPDFVRWQKGRIEPTVEGIESKMDGNLDKIEIEKCRWLLKNGVFSKIYIASKIIGSRRIKVFYEDFETKYGRSD